MVWRVLVVLQLVGCYSDDECGKCAPLDAGVRHVRSEQFRPVLCTGEMIGDPDCSAHYILLSDVASGLRLAYVAKPALTGVYFPLFELEGDPTRSFSYDFDVERWSDPTLPPVETIRAVGGGVFPRNFDWAPFAAPSYESTDYLSLAFRVTP